MKTSAALWDKARSLGVATRYEDAGGVMRTVDGSTVAAVCELIDGFPGGGAGAPVGSPGEVIVVRGGRVTSGLPTATGEQLAGARIGLDDNAVTTIDETPLEQLPLGMHDVEWQCGEHRGSRSTLIVAPHRFPALSPAQGAGPGVAVFTPTYALWSASQPSPDYGSLLDLADSLVRAGSASGGPAGDLPECIATLPLFAPGLASRFDPSPYSPVSRFHLNEIYAAPANPDNRVGRGSDAHPGGFVDWPVVARTALDRLGQRANDLDAHERRELEELLASRPEISSYARFCADGEVPAAVHEVGQWLAERRLGAVVDGLHERGFRLAADLPVGSRPDGWEQHRWPWRFVSGATIGAPPDSFFESGQDWGLAPMNPVVSRHEGHRMWHDLLANAARHADVLRIDHVMQVLRMWWVPAGAEATEGTYVAYPAEELLAVAALVAQRTATVMIGEDLGTVPPEVVALMSDWGLPGMHEEAFLLHDLASVTESAQPGSARRSAGATPPDPAGPTERLPEVPQGAWAGLRTHDMPPMAALVEEVDPERYRDALESDLGHRVGSDVGSLRAAMLERLVRSGAGEVVIDLHDVLGSTAAHNVPGTVTDENWSARLPAPVDALADDPRLAQTLAALRPATRRPAGQPSTRTPTRRAPTGQG